MTLRFAALALALGVPAAVGCAKKGEGSADAGSATVASSSASVAPREGQDRATASWADRADAAGLRGAPPGTRTVAASRTHATRARLVRLEEDPVLAANAAAVRAHFEGRAAAQLAVQTVPLTQAGAAAVVVSDATRAPGESSPFVLVVDGPSHAARWTKDHPAGGVLAPFGPFGIASGPKGRVAFAICDPPTKRVALRLWDDDGSAFADFDAMDAEDCTTTTSLYWPEHGWLVVVTRPGQTRAQLVSEGGQLRWGRGLDLGTRSKTGAAVALAQEGDLFTLVQPGAATGVPGEAEHAFAFHYDAKGALAGAPRDLGAMPRDAAILDPLPVEALRPGVLRVMLGGRGVEVAWSAQ